MPVPFRINTCCRSVCSIQFTVSIPSFQQSFRANNAHYSRWGRFLHISVKTETLRRWTHHFLWSFRKNYAEFHKSRHLNKKEESEHHNSFNSSLLTIQSKLSRRNNEVPHRIVYVSCPRCCTATLLLPARRLQSSVHSSKAMYVSKCLYLHHIIQSHSISSSFHL